MQKTDKELMWTCELKYLEKKEKTSSGLIKIKLNNRIQFLKKNIIKETKKHSLD